MPTPPARKRTIQIAVLIAVLTAPALAAAQGCAMCYNNAAAANSAAIHALRSGILILLIPPVLIFTAICLFALRNRNRFNHGNAADDIPRGSDSQLPRMPFAGGVTSPGVPFISTSSHHAEVLGRKSR